MCYYAVQMCYVCVCARVLNTYTHYHKAKRKKKKIGSVCRCETFVISYFINLYASIQSIQLHKNLTKTLQVYNNIDV